MFPALLILCNPELEHLKPSFVLDAQRRWYFYAGEFYRGYEGDDLNFLLVRLYHCLLV